jgi:hypothetical protein
MGFKKYINEGSSDKILKYIYRKKIPLSPKFFEEVFGDKERYCFVSMMPNRVPSIIKRQGKKNQVSAFNYFTDTEIFFGAWGLNWENETGGNTIVVVLKGKSTLVSPEDSWSNYDSAGRRWVDPVQYKNMMPDTKFAGVLTGIQDDIYKEFESFVKQFGFENPAEMDNAAVEDKIPGKILHKIIKVYFDISYKYLKKYKSQLLKHNFNMNPTYGYNEILCYNYKVQEIIVIEAPERKRLDDYDKWKYFEAEVDTHVPYKKYKTTFTDIQGAVKIIRNYQKKNKGL